MKSFAPLTSVALALGIAGATFVTAPAQVNGLSYTLAPRAAYLFTDAESGIGNGFAFGGDFGLGFGQYIELRANYLQGIGTQTDFGDFGLTSSNAGQLVQRDVALRRIGGDIKLNLGRGRFLPYLVTGVGVQRLELDGRAADDNIYGSGGLGLVLSAADRYTFFVEGRFTGYNHNPVRGLLTDADVTLLDISRADFGAQQQRNYSLEAGMSFYFAGRRPGDLTEVDKAYAEQFGNGFRGASFQVEPTLSRVNFDGVLPYRDTWLGGLALGTNFGPLVGFRAYYLQAMADDNVGFDFDDLALYGADFRFNLNNVATGVAPYISLGGGYIDVKDSYRSANALENAKSQGYAAGGGGIVLGLTRNIKLRAGAKVLLTSGTEVDAVQSTDQITTSTQYTFGLNLAFGRKAQDAQAIIDADREAALAVQQQESNRQSEALRKEYEAKLAAADAELVDARAAGDSIRVEQLEGEKRRSETVIAAIAETDSVATLQRTSVDGPTRPQSSSRTNNTPSATNGAAPNVVSQNETAPVQRQAPNTSTAPAPSGYVRMSAAEFEQLLSQILLATPPQAAAQPTPSPAAPSLSAPVVPAPVAVAKPSVDAEAPVAEQLRLLREDMTRMNLRLDSLQGRPSSVLPKGQSPTSPEEAPAVNPPAPAPLAAPSGGSAEVPVDGRAPKTAVAVPARKRLIPSFSNSISTFRPMVVENWSA